MGTVTFADPVFVHLAWPALALTGLLLWLEVRGRERLSRFVSAAMQARLAHGAARPRRILKFALMGATLLFGIAALMRPQTPGGTEVTTQRAGGDVLVALDVSRSMLAEDAAPNRLARAKADVRELVGRVSGHRVGLVAFAGTGERDVPPDHRLRLLPPRAGRCRPGLGRARRDPDWRTPSARRWRHSGRTAGRRGFCC